MDAKGIIHWYPVAELNLNCEKMKSSGFNARLVLETQVVLPQMASDFGEFMIM